MFDYFNSHLKKRECHVLYKRIKGKTLAGIGLELWNINAHKQGVSRQTDLQIQNKIFRKLNNHIRHKAIKTIITKELVALNLKATRVAENSHKRDLSQTCSYFKTRNGGLFIDKHVCSEFEKRNNIPVKGFIFLLEKLNIDFGVADRKFQKSFSELKKNNF